MPFQQEADDDRLTGVVTARYNLGASRPREALHRQPSLTQPAPTLRILMLAPEPFFQPRGTPFSEYHRIKALGELGHHVDLVTYPIGSDVDLPNLSIIRSPRVPFVRNVRIGPSVPKIFLDVGLAITAVRQARRVSYDAIHSHEEMGLLGVWLARRLGIPHLYDMHSSLPQQLTNFRYTRSVIARRLVEAVERKMVGGSKVVVTICPQLQDTVTAMGAGDRSILIENVMGGDVEPDPNVPPRAVREELGIETNRPVILYTGTFESYQGLEMLLDAVAILQKDHPDVATVVVGGEPAQVEAARARAERVGASVHFTGRQPARDIPAFIAACDILVSPRIAGTNTPLKIYSYLRTGKPIVATDLLTHTQVLSTQCAVLAAPEPAPFAAAIGRLISHPDEGRRLADAARRLAETRYSREVYLERTRDAYARLVSPDAGAS